jgi:hypothetical protein
VSSATDAAVLALLKATANLNVHDGYVTDSDENEKTISAPLPYIVFYTTPGRPEARSLAGPAGATVDEFQISFVGATREQAIAAAERADDAVNDTRLTSLPGQPVIRRTDDNLFVHRDDTWTRPGGKPLFYGANRYELTRTT